MAKIKTLLSAAAPFALIFVQAASAQYNPTPTTLIDYLNGAGFFATGDKNSGALSPCSIGTLVLGEPISELPDTPNLYGAPVRFSYSFSASITFNSEVAPILNATATGFQALVTFQVPCDVLPGPVPVTYTVPSASAFLGTTYTYTTTLDIRSASPGIFEIPMSDGVRRAVAVRSDGTSVSLSNPAHRGEIVRLYITGIGPTSPPLTTNALPDPDVDSHSTAAYVALQLGSSNVPVLSSSRASPSLIGVYELAFQIPIDAPTGNDVFLEVGVLVTNPGDYQFAQPNVGSRIPIQ